MFLYVYIAYANYQILTSSKVQPAIKMPLRGIK
jgi:hypothetical protein